MIKKIALENFRGFTSLELNGFKRVNLVVGQNNSGKTSLLEGISLLSNPSLVAQLPGKFRPIQGDPGTRYFRWLLRDGKDYDETLLKSNSETGSLELLIRAGDRPNQKKIPPHFSGPLVNYATLSFWGQGNQGILNCRTISVQYIPSETLVMLIGKAYRKKGGEEKLQKLLNKVDSRISKIRIDPGTDGNQIIVDVGLSELIPLSQLGQGVYRLTSILADIIGEDPKVLLIDEIENGLHHSVLEQVWTGLAETASELNVQIFATTHSGECLLAAHKAFQKQPEYNLSVIQLFRNDQGVQGRVLDKKHIEAGIEAEIELR